MERIRFTAVTSATLLLFSTFVVIVNAFYGGPNPPSYVHGHANYGPLSGLGYIGGGHFGGGYGGYGGGCGFQQCGYSGYNAGYGGLGGADYNNFAYGPNSIYGLYDNPYAGDVIGGGIGGIHGIGGIGGIHGIGAPHHGIGGIGGIGGIHGTGGIGGIHGIGAPHHGIGGIGGGGIW